MWHKNVFQCFQNLWDILHNNTTIESYIIYIICMYIICKIYVGIYTWTFEFMVYEPEPDAQTQTKILGTPLGRVLYVIMVVNRLQWTTVECYRCYWLVGRLAGSEVVAVVIRNRRFNRQTDTQEPSPTHRHRHGPGHDGDVQTTTVAQWNDMVVLYIYLLLRRTHTHNLIHRKW